ncbi:phage tail protein [Bacillus sp. IITD106]|nr:phage tail protein [Bacillus sp. IITD106]
MAIIHVLDKQTDDIIETLNNEKGEYTDAEKIDSLENKNTFDFTALKKFDVLQKRNRLLVDDVDGFFSEYIIFYAEQYKRHEKLVKGNASFIDLQKAKVIEPQKLEGQTPQTSAQFALNGTEWQVGDIDFVNIRSITIENYTDPYNLLKLIASTFELEIRFRVEVKGGKIIGRYVDMKKQIAGFEGKEIVFGKDLIGIRRIEDATNIVTALLGVGPEREDGTRLTVLVENEEARQRWGRRGQHLIQVYEPESSDQNMTESRLRTLTENELEKRIDAAVSYECEAVSLEHIFGHSHERIRLGQTVRIKDDGYNPPLYLEARIRETKEDPATRKILNFNIGNFIEYKKEDLEKQVALLRKVIAQKVSDSKLAQAIELAEQQATEKAQLAEQNAKDYADYQDVTVYQDSTIYAEQVAKNKADEAKTEAIDTARQDATEKASNAEQNAKDFAELVSEQAYHDALEDAESYVDDNALIKNKLYNGLKWSESEGLIVERLDGLVRSVMSGTDGFKVQVKDGTNWKDMFYVDSNGDVKFAGHLEGATGSFGGRLTSPMLIIGPDTPDLTAHLDGLTGARFKMIERVTDNVYRFIDDFIIEVGQGNVKFKADSNTRKYGFSFQSLVSDSFYTEDFSQMGTINRIVMEVSANSGNGVVNYITGSSFVEEIRSAAEGFTIFLRNVPDGAKISMSQELSSSNGLVVGGTSINPYIYARTMSQYQMVVGLRSGVSSGHIPWNTVSAGTLLVIISW